jgi:hypothetical protein
MRYAVWTVTPGGAKELPVPVIYRAGRYSAGMTPQSIDDDLAENQPASRQVL